MYLEPEDARGLLATLAAQSAPGSLLIAHNVTEEFLAAVDEGVVESYPPFSWDLVKTWTFGLPADPGRLLAAAGWNVKEATTRAAIAREIFGGQATDLEGCADFETLVWSPRDRAVLFVVATKP
ncbi:hypothetical protein H632_c2756p0 [Helicosporidium sp. ATCC 50920]|nr:hypothetical protein H632_c2756p0 [Helicosporidium sp. ATCC 50920]|eukprot:KDD72902.1 hypothetical protein H632_c2756p0 [Helicosporidium sp. ATCC 50920]